MSELKLYRAKLKTRKQIMAEIPREHQGWWADVCAGETLYLRDATEADLERCNLGASAPRDVAEYLCENIERGSLVRRIAIAELTEIPERGMVAHHNESVRLNARIQELEAELSRRTQPEATKPAQDLGAAIDWLRNNYQDHTNIASLCDAMCAALASPADALVAGDSTKPDADAYAKDARLALEMPAPEGTHQWLTKSSTPYPVMCSIDELNFHLKKAEHELMMWKHDTPNGKGWMVDWWQTKVDFYKEAIDAAIQAQKDGHG